VIFFIFAENFVFVQNHFKKFQKTNSKFQFGRVFYDISLEFGAWNLEFAQV